MMTATSAAAVATAFSSSWSPASLGLSREAAIPEPITAATRNALPIASAQTRRITRRAYDGRVQRVLFLCIRNSARSQMAEGLLRALAPDRCEVASAGVEAGVLRPEAVTVMREIGIDISRQRSKAASELAGREFDVVITTCDEAKEACPYVPGASRVLHWGFPDPAAVEGSSEERLAAFRTVRDGLRDAIGREFGGDSKAE